MLRSTLKQDMNNNATSFLTLNNYLEPQEIHETTDAKHKIIPKKKETKVVTP